MTTVLDAGVRLNLISLEALAAAEYLQAELCLAEADRIDSYWTLQPGAVGLPGCYRPPDGARRQGCEATGK